MVVKQYKVLTFGETKRLISLDDVLCDTLLFSEKLYIFNEHGRKIGRFLLSVDHEDFQKCKVFLVHVSSKGVMDGKTSETTVTGTVSKNLKTVEEIRCESSEVTDTGKQERRMYLLRESTKYYCSVTSSICNMEMKQQKTIAFSKSRGLMGEASNAVLMRAIAVRGFEGIICLTTILSNGKRCRNYYVSRLSHRLVNGIRTQVMIIYRNITNHKKYNLTLTGAFTRSGQMIYLFWSNTKYFLHVEPELDVYGPMVYEGRKVGIHRYWNRDQQLYSLYLDKKLEEAAHFRSLRYDQLALKQIIKDFVQDLLVVRPDDVVCYAISYFTAFGHNTLKYCEVKEEKETEKSTEAESGGKYSENEISGEDLEFVGEFGEY